MGDAVIVSAARTAIGTARKGSLVDVDVFELGQGVDQRGAEALGRSRPRTSTTSSWASRSRAAAASPATPPSTSA